MIRFFDDFLLALARRSRLAAALAVALVVALAMLIRPPTFAGSMIEQISADNPQVAAADRIAVAREHTKTVLAIIDPGNAIISRAFDDLRLLETRIAEASTAADVRSVHAYADQLFLLRLGLDDSLADFLLAIQPGDGAASLVSRDAKLFALAADIAGPDEARVLDVVETFEFSSGLVTVGTIAAVALEQDVATGLREDLRLLIPAIVFVKLSALLLAFGHWRSLVLPVFASIASAIVVFSFLSISGISINLVTLLALPIVLIIALANSCHFLAKSSKALAANQDLDAVVASTLRRVAVPYLVSCLTTAVALASLSLNNIAPIRDLGLLAAGSLLASFTLIILVAPWALRWHLSVRGSPVYFSRAYSQFSRGLRRHRRTVAKLMVAAAAASLFALPYLQVRSDPEIFFPDNADFTRAAQLFEDRFYGYAPFRVLVASRVDPSPSLQTLRFAGKIRDRFLDATGVRDARIVAAAGGGFLITALVSTPAVTAALVDQLDALQNDNAAFDIVYSSSRLVYEGIDKQAMSSLVTSLTLSLLIIFGVIFLMFRSMRTLFASLVSNAVPLLIVSGVVWLVGDPLNLVTAFVFLVALGVIVDDTIHILYRHRCGDALAGSSIEFSVVLSTIMLCIGLLLCQLSDFPTTRQFALYFALALTGAVGSDLTLLPLLLNWRKAPADD